MISYRMNYGEKDFELSKDLALLRPVMVHNKKKQQKILGIFLAFSAIVIIAFQSLEVRLLYSFILCLFLYMLATIDKRQRKALHRSTVIENPSYKDLWGVREYYFSPEGISYKSAHNSWWNDWSCFSAYGTYQGYIYIRCLLGGYVLVKQDDLVETELNALMELLKAHCPAE